MREKKTNNIKKKLIKILLIVLMLHYTLKTRVNDFSYRFKSIDLLLTKKRLDLTVDWFKHLILISDGCYY